MRTDSYMRVSTDLFMVLAIQCYFSALLSTKLPSYSQTVETWSSRHDKNLPLQPRASPLGTWRLNMVSQIIFWALIKKEHAYRNQVLFITRREVWMHLKSSVIAKDLNSIPLQRYVFSPSCRNRAGLRVTLRLLSVRLIPPAPNTYRPWLITGQRPGVLRKGTQAQFSLFSCKRMHLLLCFSSIPNFWHLPDWIQVLVYSAFHYKEGFCGIILIPNEALPLFQYHFLPPAKTVASPTADSAALLAQPSQHFLLPGLSATAAVSVRKTRTDCSINWTRNFVLSRSQTGPQRFQVLN